jgi:error-prone DNA polymerase
MTGYCELQVTTNFSFLRGGSHAEELVAQAKHLGLSALAVTDRNTLAGVVRAHVAGKDMGLKIVVGCRLDLAEDMSLLCYPQNRSAYGRLCSLLTVGQRRAEKGCCILTLADVARHQDGMIFIALPPPGLPDEAFEEQLRQIVGAIKAPLHLAATMLYSGRDRARLNRLAALSRAYRMPLVATNDVLYHHHDRRPLQDVLTCIREKCTIHEAGFRLAANAERHLKPPEEMARLFHGHEHALARTLAIAEACTFSLDELRYEYPDEPVPEGTTAQEHLEALAWKGAEARYPEGIPAKVRASIVNELELIGRLRIAPYFLTVHDIVDYARTREKPILCQGRGSAANSAVCYCIGITNVDPATIDLLFERFVSEERKEPPDIDVDFEHERREEVIQYIYSRYGRDRAGLAATVITYRGRSAVRDVGKAMGLSEDVTSALAGIVWGRMPEDMTAERLKQKGLDGDDPLLMQVLSLAEQITGFPRHLSQHVGGFVLTKGPLSETVPIGNAAMQDRTVIEWDKDDIDALGILKVDVLGLGMLTCIRKCFELMEGWYGLTCSLATIPPEDQAVYDMLCRADSVGVFQVESRAQMNMLPRLKPRTFYDLVIEVAIVRPGPIQGDMVHPYLRRRDKLEPEDYPAPDPAFGPAHELKAILGKTMGVPLFQEQAMRLAMVAAEFTPGEVNELRKAMATFRRRGTIGRLEEKMITRMVERGYDSEFAHRCFNQIKGFGEYGFPESHAASFAHLVYVSAWLKCHYPAVFAAALLNSQPMGFYASAQIVRDAQDHGVDVRHPDVNLSEWDAKLESVSSPSFSGAMPTRDGKKPSALPALRLGLRGIDGLPEKEGRAIAAGRPFTALADLRHRAGISIASLEKLAAADAFRSLGRDRRAALWQVKALARAKPLPLFEAASADDRGMEFPVALPPMRLSEHVVNDYQTIKLSLKAHPMSFLRQMCNAEGVIDHARLKKAANGKPVSVAGIVLVRQRPGSAKGVVFITLEDEFGVCNLVVWPKALEAYRATVMGARLLLVRGRIQRHNDIIHVVANHLEDKTVWLDLLSADPSEFGNPLARADEVIRPGYDRRSPSHPRNVRIMPKSRDFH